MSDPVLHTVPSDAHDRAVAVQVLAFSGDPIMRWLYPDPATYLEAFPGFARAFGGRAFDEDTAFACTEFGGCSMWLPPGVHADGDAIESHLRDTVDKDRQDDLFTTLDHMDRLHPKEPHWYLSIIGVEPARQGRGLGAALLQHTLAPLAGQGLPAYLESSNPANVSLYRRHGFEVVEEIESGSMPRVTAMFREAT